MNTKKLYNILDKVPQPNIAYNLRKIRNIPVWRVRVWVRKSLDRLGIFAPYIEDELYPEHYEIADTVADFVRICNLALKRCA